MRVFDLERLRNWFSPGYIKYSLSVRSRRSPLFIFFMVFVLIGVATLLGMSAYFFGLFDPDSLRAEGISGEYDSGFLDTLLWSLKHILDPGAWSEDYSAPLMITLIGLVNTITGLIIVGILIGFVVNFIQNAMDELKRGSIDVHESGHFLILGWNRKVLSILTFLEELNKKQSVVLLSNADIDLVSEEVRHVERNFRNVTVIPQHGSPTLAAELERVAIRESSSVVLLADEVDESSDQSNDIPTIKSLMQLDNVSWYGKRPNIVVEVANKENLDMVELASGASVPVVSSADFVSKTLVQCARYQGYAEIYSTIFAFEDNEIQIRKMEGIEGKLFGELAEQLESAILLVAGLAESAVVPRYAWLRAALHAPEEPQRAGWLSSMGVGMAVRSAQDRSFRVVRHPGAARACRARAPWAAAAAPPEWWKRQSWCRLRPRSTSKKGS